MPSVDASGPAPHYAAVSMTNLPHAVWRRRDSYDVRAAIYRSDPVAALFGHSAAARPLRGCALPLRSREPCVPACRNRHLLRFRRPLFSASDVSTPLLRGVVSVLSGNGLRVPTRTLVQRRARRGGVAGRDRSGAGRHLPSASPVPLARSDTACGVRPAGAAKVRVAADTWSSGDLADPRIDVHVPAHRVLLRSAARHDSGHVGRTLSYFFMLPNACFPLFPVIDYKTFRRNYYDEDA